MIPLSFKHLFEQKALRQSIVTFRTTFTDTMWGSTFVGSSDGSKKKRKTSNMLIFVCNCLDIHLSKNCRRRVFNFLFCMSLIDVLVMFLWYPGDKKCLKMQKHFKSPSKPRIHYTRSRNIAPNAQQLTLPLHTRDRSNVFVVFWWLVRDVLGMFGWCFGNALMMFGDVWTFWIIFWWCFKLVLGGCLNEFLVMFGYCLSELLMNRWMYPSTFFTIY